MLKKIVSWGLIMCLTIITLLLPGRTVNFAWQSVYAVGQSEDDPAMISSGITAIVSIIQVISLPSQQLKLIMNINLFLWILQPI